MNSQLTPQCIRMDGLRNWNHFNTSRILWFYHIDWVSIKSGLWMWHRLPCISTLMKQRLLETTGHAIYCHGMGTYTAVYTCNFLFSQHFTIPLATVQAFGFARTVTLSPNQHQLFVYPNYSHSHSKAITTTAAVLRRTQCDKLIEHTYDATCSTRY